MGPLDEFYGTFKEYGFSKRKPLHAYKKIRFHLIFNLKRDGEMTKAFQAHPDNGNNNGETSSHCVDGNLFHDLLTG